ncbi:MAG: hypothetical protein ABWY13_06470 [Mesorhizobium sp.]|jgi:hypothetical protein
MRRISMAIAGLLVLSGCESSGTGTGPVASAGGAPSEMSSICRSEAATEFGQPAENVRTVPIEQSVDGYSVYGQWPPEGKPEGIFVCRFDGSGSFKGVSRA